MHISLYGSIIIAFTSDNNVTSTQFALEKNILFAIKPSIYSQLSFELNRILLKTYKTEPARQNKVFKVHNFHHFVCLSFTVVIKTCQKCVLCLQLLSQPDAAAWLPNKCNIIWPLFFKQVHWTSSHITRPLFLWLYPSLFLLYKYLCPLHSQLTCLYPSSQLHVYRNSCTILLLLIMRNNIQHSVIQSRYEKQLRNKNPKWLKLFL